MKDRIIQEQRKILEGLVAWESMIGELYERYAILNPQNRQLWSAMASEERVHSTMLASLHTLLDSGHLFWNIGQFHHELIADELAFVRDALNHARSGNPSEADCITVAIRIETSLIDSKFYAVVKSEAKEFAYICKALSVATTKHVQRLKDRIGKTD